MTPTCSAVTRDGRPCGAAPRRGETTCLNHSSDLELQRRLRDARSRGGKESTRNREGYTLPAGIRPPWWKLKRPGEIADAAAFFCREFAAGRLSAKSLTAITGALNTTAGLRVEADPVTDRAPPSLEIFTPDGTKFVAAISVTTAGATASKAPSLPTEHPLLAALKAAGANGTGTRRIEGEDA